MSVELWLKSVDVVVVNVTVTHCMDELSTFQVANLGNEAG